MARTNSRDYTIERDLLATWTMFMAIRTVVNGHSKLRKIFPRRDAATVVNGWPYVPLLTSTER